MEKVKDYEGLQDTARFALRKNSLMVCGTTDDQIALRKFIEEPNSRNYHASRKILSEQEKYPDLNAFLRALAKKNKEDMFSTGLARRYWLGGDLVVGGRELLVEQYKQTKSTEFVKEVILDMPEDVYLTHTYQVMKIATAKEPEEEKGIYINTCMVARARIISIDNTENKATVTREVVRKYENGYKIFEAQQTVGLNLALSPVEIGNEVALHLGCITRRLEEDEAKQLSYWNKKIAESIKVARVAG